jgi:hypothetical protein
MPAYEINVKKLYLTFPIFIGCWILPSEFEIIFCYIQAHLQSVPRIIRIENQAPPANDAGVAMLVMSKPSSHSEKERTVRGPEPIRKKGNLVAVVIKTLTLV